MNDNAAEIADHLMCFAQSYRRSHGKYPRVIKLYGSLAKEFNRAFRRPVGADPDWHITVCGVKVEAIIR